MVCQFWVAKFFGVVGFDFLSVVGLIAIEFVTVDPCALHELSDELHNMLHGC